MGEVAFTAWTRERILRRPTWRGLRPDKHVDQIDCPPRKSETQAGAASPRARFMTCVISARSGSPGVASLRCSRRGGRGSNRWPPARPRDR
ncbi:hypothetical protein NDR87_29990 [Nocardia sp. CDC159]|uniref:Uncharacterized protein n=1 Tax=Nocardia pulmonis TaxID=2951408 RepID=A0A9X2EEN3_9NOCA|nr:hypothetical protein [Nocardia pulmonis]MCM6790608.1 hypothetical protein [Nocardia sp. CDC159]